MPKVKDKGLKGAGRGQRKTPDNDPAMVKPKAAGKTRKKVQVDRDAVLKESNQDFDPRPKGFKGKNWTRGEIINLFIAANARRKFLKGPYEYHSGGNDSRTRAWQEVSDFVNDISVQHRTVDQCKNKITDFVGAAKDKLRVLKKMMSKTGAPAIPDEKQLLREDIMALDYAGDEAVTGIPGTKATTVFKKRAAGTVPKPWTTYRVNKPDYYESFKAGQNSKDNA